MDDVLSSSGASTMGGHRKPVSYDPLNPMIGSIQNRQFYHPYVQQLPQVSFWRHSMNRAFEILELMYFYFTDLIEGIISLFGRFFFGMFYILC